MAHKHNHRHHRYHRYHRHFHHAISRRMIRRAAKAMHVKLPKGFAKKLMKVAKSETQNHNIRQRVTDINSYTGNLAQGPLQYTPKTFAQYAMPHHRNIHKPYNQLLAFFNNSDWKHSIGRVTIRHHRKTDWLHMGPRGHRRYGRRSKVLLHKRHRHHKRRRKRCRHYKRVHARARWASRLFHLSSLQHIFLVKMTKSDLPHANLAQIKHIEKSKGMEL